MPKISILIPCCNVEKFVDECLQSIQNQTLSDFEALCINDGSKDGTLEILKKYAEKDKRFIVIDKKNSGYGDSMNIGLSRCSGDYVGIVESDDFIEPNMYELLYNAAEKNRLDIARAGYFIYTEGVNDPVLNEWIPKNKVVKPIDRPGIFYQAPAIWASLYKRSFLVENEINFIPSPGASYQDTSFAFKSYYKCDRFMMLDVCLLHYRQHSGGSVKSSGKVFCVCDEWDEIIRFAKKDQERFEKVKDFLCQVREGTYLWNFNRLSGDSQKDFLMRWSKDLKRAESEGLRLRLDRKSKRRARWIKSFPQLYWYYIKVKKGGVL